MSKYFFNAEHYQFVATIKTGQKTVSAVFRDMSKPNSDNTIKIFNQESLAEMLDNQNAEDFVRTPTDIPFDEVNEAWATVTARQLVLGNRL